MRRDAPGSWSATASTSATVHGVASVLTACGFCTDRALSGLRVTIPSSRAHLRRAGPDGPGREQRGRARAVEGKERPGWPAIGGRGSPGGLAVAGRPASPRPSDATPTDAAAGLARYPGDRTPAVPAVSRCRTRQHHGHTDDPAPDAPGTVKMSQPAGLPAAHCPGWPLQPQRCFASRWRGTRLRRAVDPGDLCQPSGPNGEGPGQRPGPERARRTSQSTTVWGRRLLACF